MLVEMYQFFHQGKKDEVFQIHLVQAGKKTRSLVDINLFIALEKVEFKQMYLIR